MIEVGVSRVAHCQCLAVGIDKRAVHALLIGRECLLSLRDPERHVAELHKLALKFGQSGVVEFVEVVERDAVEFIFRIVAAETDLTELRIRESVEFRIRQPVVVGHEAELRLAVVGLAGRADLLQTAVIAYVKPGEIHHHVLTETIFVVEASLIDRECERGGLVLYHKRLVDVARRVARHDTPVYDVTFASDKFA